MDRAAVDDLEPASRTVTVNDDVPGATGVPVTAPVDASRPRPDGRAPDVTDHVYGAVPPVAPSVAAYPWPTCPPGSAVVVTDQRGRVDGDGERRRAPQVGRGGVGHRDGEGIGADGGRRAGDGPRRRIECEAGRECPRRHRPRVRTGAAGGGECGRVPDAERGVGERVRRDGERRQLEHQGSHLAGADTGRGAAGPSTDSSRRTGPGRPTAPPGSAQVVPPSVVARITPVSDV